MIFSFQLDSLYFIKFRTGFNKKTIAIDNCGLIVYNEDGIPVSVSEKTVYQNWVNVFPNPTTDVVNLSSKYTIRSVKIIDLQGRVIETTNRNSHSINLTGFNNGLYFLRIDTDKGLVVKKIIKQ